ncbi:hypothetical protein EHQ58_18475, partial [Leptospira ognonensis]
MTFDIRNALAIFQRVGANDNFVTLILHPDSDDYKRFGSTLSGFIHYTKNQRKYFSGEQIILGFKEDISFLKLNTLDLNYPIKTKTFLLTKGIFIQSVRQIIYTPKDDDLDGIPKKHKNKITIPLEPASDPLETEKLSLFLYKKYLNSQVKFLKSEKEKYIGIYLGLYEKVPAELLEKIQLDPKEIETNDQIHRYYLNTKKKTIRLTDEESKRLIE